MSSQYSQSVVGAIVEIVSSTSTRQRMPHLIGKIGTIKVIPTHPSTWYVVDIPKVGVVRLQPTGFNVISIANLTTESRHYNKVMEYINNKKICDSDVANGDNVIDESEPIDEDDSENANQNVTLLTKGARVQLLPTTDVMHRLPYLIGKTGIIKETPLHHIHWYKVELDDGTIISLRPSALQLSNDDSDNAIKTNNSNGGSSSEVPASNVFKLKAIASNDSIVSSKSGQKIKRKLLSDTDPETWVGRKVKIIKEKLVGSIGVVLRSGNGWVQVETDCIEGEIAKRAYELEIILDESSMDDLASLDQSSDKKYKKVPNKGWAPYAKRQKLKLATLGSNTSKVKSGSVSSNLESLGRTADPSPVNGLDESETPTPLLTRSRASSIDMTARQDPKISVAFRELKRQLTQKYVDRHQEKIATRPDLMYWLHHLQAGMVDSEYDRQVAKEFEDTYCENCFTEKWPNSIFCWNKMCSISPIYWEKLGPDERPDDIEFHKEESIHRSANTPRLNVVSDFLISVPSRLIGVNRDTEKFDSLDEDKDHLNDKDKLPTNKDEDRNLKKKKLETNHSHADSEQSLKRSRLR